MKTRRRKEPESSFQKVWVMKQADGLSTLIHGLPTYMKLVMNLALRMIRK